jgi:hypothetical protein
MTTGYEADIAAIAGIDAVPTILEVVCKTTAWVSRRSRP